MSKPYKDKTKKASMKKHHDMLIGANMRSLERRLLTEKQIQKLPMTLKKAIIATKMNVSKSKL